MDKLYWKVNKKIIFFSCYLMFLSLGILSFWSSLTSLSDNILVFFLPICYTLGIILLGTVLFSRSVLKMLYLLCYLLSLVLIVSGTFELLGLVWNDQLIAAFVYLLALGSSMGLFAWEKQKEMMKALVIPVTYSTFFLLLLMITRLIPFIYRDMLSVILVGQGVAFILSLGFVWVMDSEGKEFPSRERRKWKNKQALITIYHRLYFLLYLVLLLSSWVYVSMISDLWQLIVLLLLFSLFLLAALHSSLVQSMQVHILLAFVSFPLSLLWLSGVGIGQTEMMMGIFLFLGIGSYLLLMWVYAHGMAPFRLYLQAFFTLLLSLFPLLIGDKLSAEIRQITFVFICAYSILHLFSLFLLPLMKRKWLIPRNRKRAKRVLPRDMAVQDKEGRGASIAGDRNDEASIRERNLMLMYKNWLDKKGDL